MNKIKYLLFASLLAVFSFSLSAEGTYVLDAERAILNTQYAESEAKKMSEDADYVADMERLELLQAEGQAIIEDFEKNQETLSDQQKIEMQGKLEDKQTEIQFLTQKLQNKAQDTRQAILAALSADFQRILGELINAKNMDMVLSPQALFYADPDLDITDEVTALLDVALAEKSE